MASYHLQTKSLGQVIVWMKINPENFILNEELCFKYSSFFISGNDESYIQSLVELLTKSFSKKGYLKKRLVGEASTSPDLFNIENKSLYIADKYLGDEVIQEIEQSGDVFIFYEKNSLKNKLIKKGFSNSKQKVLIECYELDQNTKKIILNEFIKKHNLIFENDTYWLLLDLLSNKFSILQTELEKILLLGGQNDDLSLASALNLDQAVDGGIFFFKTQLKSVSISSHLNSSINSLSDFYSYFSYFKFFSLLLINSENKLDLEKKIPKYLFKEKQSLIKIFSFLNENKKKYLSFLILKTERLVRKNPNLYKSLFFRFVMNYRKIIS